MTRPLLGLTIGDPAGVGPEVIAKALNHPHVYETCRPLVLGDLYSMQRAVKLLELPLRVNQVATPSAAGYSYGTIELLQTSPTPTHEIAFGKLDAAAGRVGVEAVKCAVELAQTGQIDAIVTAPLNKEAISLAGYSYPGHTEILAELTGGRAAMLLVTDRLRVVHVSTHLSLRDALGLVSTERVLETIRLAQRAASDLGIPTPRIAVAGVNPHAGEGGRFGSEEIDAVEPAVRLARAEGIDARGSVPPDTLFMRANLGEFDMVVAMYHDQGHIPVKMLGFDEGTNVTIGLPIIRTSVDHGTAFDIAGMGIARESSMLQAIQVALQLVAARQRTK